MAAGIFNATIFNNSIFNTGGGIPPGTIFYQGDGVTRKRRKPRRTEQDFFKSLEQTIYETLHPVEPVVSRPIAHRAADAAGPASTAPTLDKLRALSQDYEGFAIRLQRLEHALAAHQAEENRKIEAAREQDDEEIMLLL